MLSQIKMQVKFKVHEESFPQGVRVPTGQGFPQGEGSHRGQEFLQGVRGSRGGGGMPI